MTVQATSVACMLLFIDLFFLRLTLRFFNRFHIIIAVFRRFYLQKRVVDVGIEQRIGIFFGESLGFDDVILPRFDIVQDAVIVHIVFVVDLKWNRHGS